jgi:hypothetical protein
MSSDDHLAQPFRLLRNVHVDGKLFVENEAFEVRSAAYHTWEEVQALAHGGPSPTNPVVRSVPMVPRYSSNAGGKADVGAGKAFADKPLEKGDWEQYHALLAPDILPGSSSVLRLAWMIDRTGRYPDADIAWDFWVEVAPPGVPLPGYGAVSPVVAKQTVSSTVLPNPYAVALTELPLGVVNPLSSCVARIARGTLSPAKDNSSNLTLLGVSIVYLATS